jgi:hypothetical protein
LEIVQELDGFGEGRIDGKIGQVDKGKTCCEFFA